MSTKESYSARNPNDYLKTRVDFKTEAYRRKGERYRWSYLITAATAAIAAAAVPVLINLDGVTSCPDVLSTCGGWLDKRSLLTARRS